MIEKEILGNSIVPLPNTHVFNGAPSHIEKWNFLKSNIFVRFYIFGMADVFLRREFQEVNEQIVEKCIQIDFSEAENYE